MIKYAHSPPPQSTSPPRSLKLGLKTFHVGKIKFLKNKMVTDNYSCQGRNRVEYMNFINPVPHNAVLMRRPLSLAGKHANYANAIDFSSELFLHK